MQTNINTETSIFKTRIIIDTPVYLARHVLLSLSARDERVTMVTNDVIPYGLVQGPRGALDGLNLVGLKRKGVDRMDITALRAAFQMLAQGDGTFLERTKKLGDETTSTYVQDIVEFVLGHSDRSFLTPS